jgi:hypothetical protein
MADDFQALLKSFADGHWYKHQDALVHIVELRGGSEAIENEYPRITLAWYVLYQTSTSY